MIHLYRREVFVDITVTEEDYFDKAKTYFLLKDTEEENAVCFPFGRRVICAMKARKLQ